MLGLALALAVLLLVLLAGLFAAVLAFLGLVLRVGVALGFGQIERGQQFPRGAREGHLVVLRAVHLDQRRVGRLAQRVAPHVQDALRRRRRRLARHLLARQQGQRRRDRQLVLARHAVVAFGLALLAPASRADWPRRPPCGASPPPRRAPARARRRRPSPRVAPACARRAPHRRDGAAAARSHPTHRAAGPSRPAAAHASATAGVRACRTGPTGPAGTPPARRGFPRSRATRRPWRA